MTYIVERMTYISYGDLTGNGKFNNCTVWIQVGQEHRNFLKIK